MPCYDGRDQDAAHKAYYEGRAIVPACLDEIKTGKPFSYFNEDGSYKDFDYIKNRKANDLDTAELCDLCKTIDVTAYSLELQIWWRDHKKWDRERKAKAKTVLVVAIQDGIHVIEAACNDLRQEPWTEGQHWSHGYPADTFVQALEIQGLTGRDAILFCAVSHLTVEEQHALIINLMKWTKACLDKHHKHGYVMKLDL